MATGRITTYPAAVYYEANFNTGPGSALPPLWTDITRRALGPQSVTHGKQYELDRNEAGTYQPVLDNRDGALDPSNPASPYAPNVQPYRGVRERRRFNANLLTADQATAGEGTPVTGATPVWLGVGNNQGYPVTIAASGSAYQGAQVYQAVLPIGATAGATVMVLRGDGGVPGAAVVPGRGYSWQAQCRIPSGNSVSTQAAIAWFDNLGNTLGTTTGGASTLTSGSASWVQLSTSGVAPTGAFSAWLYVQIASGTLAAQTTWQIDGLQWEESAAPTAWQTPSSVSANLLPRAVATGAASINPVTDSAGAWFYPVAGSVARATNLTAAPTGHTTAAAWTSPAGTTSSSPLYGGVVGPAAPDPLGPVEDTVQVTAGQQYTSSLYLMRASSADATVQVQAAIRWYTATGTVISSSAGAAATVPVGSWVRAAVTATAPAGAAWGRPRASISTPASTTATNILYCTGWQFEQAAAASAWSDPGLTGYGFTGYLEQLPQRWRLSQTWGELDAAGVDALAGFAQYTVQSPFVEETLALAPDFIYQLNDPAGSASCADTTGNRIPAPVEVSPFGAGSLVFGSSITSANPGSAFAGTPGPVATFANPASSSSQTACTFISIHKTTGTPGPPQSGGWTRLIAFRGAATPTNTVFLWSALPPGWLASNSSQFAINMNAAGPGIISCNVFNALGTGTSIQFAASNYADGNWHLVTVSLSSNGLTLTASLDGTVSTAASAGDAHPTGIVTDVLGASVQFGPSQYDDGYAGDLAFAAQIPVALTSAQITTLYNSWRTASQGESSGARAKRLLNWVGWNGRTAIDNGSTASMGPATDLAGSSALDGLNAIAATEGGNAYAALNGAIAFKSRAASYNSAPAFVFGENQAWGEWPFEDVLLPDDPFQTYNIVPTTQYSTGQVALAQSAASQAAYFPRTYPGRVINSTSFPEVADAGAYLLSQHKTPAIRCSGLRIHASAIPGLMRVCSQVEIGTRIRVYKGSPYRSTRIQFDGFVQRIEHSRDPVSGNTYYTLEASPADLATYWVLAALHTTLHAQALSGQNQIQINALPDSATNALAQSLPQGYQLVLDPGTAIQETATLAPTGIPATSPGYSTATLTLTGNLLNTHAAGAVVCEPLPVGYTDPTSWDASSVLGAASSTVAAGGASGTNTVTVNALGDGSVNALGSDWNTGDLLWLSPGTVNFEGYNLLHPNVATAGEGALPLAAGTSGAALGLSSDVGTPTVTASGTAQQGANVWAVAVAGGIVPTKGLLYILKVPVTAGLAYTASEYTRSATTGANPTVQIYLKFLDATGASLAQTNSGSTVLTGSPTAAWTRMAVTATAPATAVWAQVGLLLTATAPAGAWTWQADALQLEQSGSASVFCVTPQVKSVAFSVPGYSTVTITLNTNLLNSHAAGDVVCDPLPSGDTAVSQVPATTRVAY